jgi:hypothetical protein
MAKGLETYKGQLCRGYYGMHIHGAEKNVEQSGAVWSVARQIRKKTQS